MNLSRRRFIAALGALMAAPAAIAKALEPKAQAAKDLLHLSIPPAPRWPWGDSPEPNLWLSAEHSPRIEDRDGNLLWIGDASGHGNDGFGWSPPPAMPQLECELVVMFPRVLTPEERARVGQALLHAPALRRLEP